MTVTRRDPLFIPGLAAVLLATWLAYAPGLDGGFQFDDFANLPALGASGPVDDQATFWRYITSGTADPTGRPLALLTFLLDAQDWPADPRPFLRSNLILHLINGVLLALLLRQLGRMVPSAVHSNDRWHAVADERIGKPKRRWLPLFLTRRFVPSPGGTGTSWRIDLAAVLGAALWLLHPLLVSTTLYIVQREAMLPATFTLLGLLLWLHGRSLLARGHPRRGLLWLALGLGGCTALAVLSKANGALLPALALVIEYTLLAGEAHRMPATDGRRTVYRWAMAVLAWLPAAAVAGFLLRVAWTGLIEGISAARPWTLGERLLTQPRVLMDYLGLLWLPRPFTPGLFNDQIQASTSLLSPASTLPALLAVCALVIGACLLRKRWPAVAIAVLFYLVGQSLESTTIALELYFEHRNYLPALLMFWPLALWLCGVRQETAGRRASNPAIAERGQPPGKRRTHGATRDIAKLALALALLAGLATMTHARASLWGNAHDQALLWAELNPESPRAQANAALTEIRSGHPARAVARLQPRLAAEPAQVQLALNLFDAQCALGEVSDTSLQATRIALRTTRDPGTLLARWFGEAIASSANPACPQARLPVLQRLLDAAQHNPHLLAVPGRRQELHSLQGRIALIRGRPDVALTHFNDALDQNIRATTALSQAARLGSHGYPRRALAHLDHYDAIGDTAAHVDAQTGSNMRSLHAWVLRRQQYWQQELARLRATLHADAKHQDSTSEQ